MTNESEDRRPVPAGIAGGYTDDLTLRPDPTRTIEGFRDTGYSFETAIADVIDNSVAAKATHVEIAIAMDLRGEITVTVADDGEGMDYDGLRNAMRYGSVERQDKASLGKFGLGMKTASTAFCRRLAVISRNSPDSTANKLVWDLDHVAAVHEWQVLREDPSENELDLLNSVSNNASGTVVIWQKIDRLFKREFQVPGGGPMRNAFNKAVDDVRDHIAVTYHRFLDPTDDRARNITLNLNNARVEAWDPFCRNVPGVTVDVLAEQNVQAQRPDGHDTAFNVRAVCLPRAEELDRSLHDRVRITTDNQGFWVYREQRLILYGTWLGMFAREPHLSLLRVQLDFDHTLDEFFSIDIKKSRIELHSQIRDYLVRQFLPAPRREADNRYRRGTRSQASSASTGIHARSSVAIGNRAPDVQRTNVRPTGDGRAEVTNTHGTTFIQLRVETPGENGEVVVKPVDTIDDGLLWEPTIISGHHAVRLNTGHPYYQRVYLPNRLEGVIIQGLDSLLWALAEAEYAAVDESTKDHMQEVRYEVSRILRRLAQDLPEHSVTSEGATGS